MVSPEGQSNLFSVFKPDKRLVFAGFYDTLNRLLRLTVSTVIAKQLSKDISSVALRCE